MIGSGCMHDRIATCCLLSGNDRDMSCLRAERLRGLARRSAAAGLQVVPSRMVRIPPLRAALFDEREHRTS